jgi:4'-phosphopantetheinyl transferase
MTGSGVPSSVLAADRVEVWTVALDGDGIDVPALADVLSADERARAARYYFEKDRRQFVVARGVLRSILAGYTGVAAHALRFSYTARGKPTLDPADGAGDLHFSVSHTHGRALYGVVRGRAVGVDIERVRDGVAFNEIAGRFFSQTESATLASLPNDERPQAFFRCWTRKEAYVKAVGGGLSIPFDQFEVTLRSGDPVVLKPIRRPDAEEERWSLWEVMSGPDYIAAVAVEGQGVGIVRREWAPAPPAWSTSTAGLTKPKNSLR